jgi:hypothetical protein
MANLRRVLVLILILISGKIYSQSYLFEYNGNYKYFIGNAEPDANWRKTDFDDTTWTPGYCGIGYGDIGGYDSTFIDTATSIYLRIKFYVTDKAAIIKLNYLVDFDDAFVAYLNDTEIVRVNLGKPKEFIPHDRQADRAHETYLNRKFTYIPLRGYFIDSATLSKCLLNGINVLSVQVHNDSVKGSDLSFVSSLFDLTNEPFSFYDAKDQCIKQTPLDSSNLPIVMINTDGYGLPKDHVKYNAHMGVIYNGKDKINRITDTCTDFNGKILLEIRGQISRDVPKKSYGVTTLDSTGKEKNVKLIGMPKDNDWILYGPILDKSLIRNDLAMKLGRKQGHYEPRMRNCELVLDGECLGLYALMENIKRDSSRVNVSKLKPLSTDITGGYIVKFDKPNNTSLQWVYPKKDSITAGQKSYITNYVNSYFAILNKPELIDVNNGFRKYIDAQSLLDYMIINELIKNCDSYLNSTFLYKNIDGADGKLKFGPLWDNDLAFGNGPWQSGGLTYGWQFEVNQNLGIKKALSDTVFANEFADEWFALRDTGFLQTDQLMNLIDTLTNNIKEARLRNYSIWQTVDKDIWSTWNFTNFNRSTSYEGDTAKMKNWLRLRLAWIDANISKIYYKLPVGISTNIAGTDEYNAYPNPFSDQIRVELIVNEPGTFSFETVDLFGRVVVLSNNVKLTSGYYGITLENGKLNTLSPGIYILIIRHNGNIVHQEKMIKE